MDLLENCIINKISWKPWTSEAFKLKLQMTRALQLKVQITAYPRVKLLQIITFLQLVMPQIIAYPQLEPQITIYLHLKALLAACMVEGRRSGGWNNQKQDSASLLVLY